MEANATINGPSWAHQRNAIFTGVPMMAQHRMLAWELCDFSGDRGNFDKKPYIFVIFQGGGGVRTPCPPLWIRP